MWGGHFSRERRLSSAVAVFAVSFGIVAEAEPSRLPEAVIVATPEPGPRELPERDDAADDSAGSESSDPDPRSGPARPSGFRADPPRRRPYVSLFVAETIFLAGGSTWYWIDKDFNARDWDYSSWRQRFSLDAFRYDDNQFSTNWVFHPLSGSAFHGFARANGFGFGASLGVSFLTSTTWESIIEFREIFSVNDLIATPGAGAPMGEFFHHLGNYLFHVHAPTSRHLGHRALAWSFGLPTTFHRWLNGATPVPELEPLFDARFRLAYGVESWNTNRGGAFPVHTLALEASVADHTYSGAPTPRMRYFHDGDYTTFRLRLEFLRDRPGIDLLSDVVVLGGIRRVGDGVATTMHETAIGANIGFIYQRREWDRFADNYGVLEIFGPSLNHRSERGPLRFDLRFRAAPTFGALTAPGYARWQAENVGVQGKAILEGQGYYNAFGASVRLESDLRYGPLELGGRVAFAYANSSDGIDREQQDVEVDQECDELRVTWQAHARVRPIPTRGLVLGFEVRGLRSRSRIEDVETNRSFYAIGGSIGHVH